MDTQASKPSSTIRETLIQRLITIKERQEETIIRLQDIQTKLDGPQAETSRQDQSQVSQQPSVDELLGIIFCNQETINNYSLVVTRFI